MNTPVVHFEINCKDGKRAQKFFGSLFNWNIDAPKTPRKSEKRK